MSDFSDALRARLDSNDALRERRAEAEAEMAREEAAAAAREEERLASLTTQHQVLAAHLGAVADQLKAARPDSFIVRSGWSASGEEFVCKISTRQMTPKRTLMVEVDHDDDEVLARWTSDIGGSVEIWRLLEVSPDMLGELVLQVADDAVWTGRTPPAFPAKAV